MFFQEFDKQAAKTVQHLFEEIDSVLFEQSRGAPPYIHKECQEWGAQFPHLRYPQTFPSTPDTPQQYLINMR
jgi:hypothetical protein